MQSSGRIGESAIHRGAHRAKLPLGVDQRILVVVAVLMVIGTKFLILFVVAFVIFGIGRMLGEKSAYFIDEVGTYLSWRVSIWSNVMPDDAYWTSREPKFVREFRKAKA